MAYKVTAEHPLPSWITRHPSGGWFWGQKQDDAFTFETHEAAMAAGRSAAPAHKHHRIVVVTG